MIRRIYSQCQEKTTCHACGTTIHTVTVLDTKLPQIDCGRLQYLERIAETADAFEKWLGENTGTNDDWPIEIKADEAGAAQLSRLLTDLKYALAPLRANKPPTP